jgi:hypothetical protein
MSYWWRASTGEQDTQWQRRGPRSPACRGFSRLRRLGTVAGGQNLAGPSRLRRPRPLVKGRWATNSTRACMPIAGGCTGVAPGFCQSPASAGNAGAQDRNRTSDTRIFRNGSPLVALHSLAPPNGAAASRERYAAGGAAEHRAAGVDVDEVPARVEAGAGVPGRRCDRY